MFYIVKEYKKIVYNIILLCYSDNSKVNRQLNNYNVSKANRQQKLLEISSDERKPKTFTVFFISNQIGNQKRLFKNLLKRRVCFHAIIIWNE